MGNGYEDFWMKLGGQKVRSTYSQIQDEFCWNIPEYYNIAVDACDRHASDRVAIIYDKEDGSHESWTFTDLKASSNRLANALQGLGIGKQDRVAIFLSQSPILPIAHFATYKLGAIAVPLFTLFGSDAVLYRLNDSASKVIITDAAHVDMIMDQKSQIPELKHVIVVDKKKPGTLYLDDLLLPCSSDFTPVQTKADDPAVIIYTSGTTGPAKGALHAHRLLLGHLPGVSLPHELAPQPADLFWTPADWAWIGGMFDVLFPALHWGLPIVAHRMTKFDPEHAFELMARWHIKNVFLPPTAIKMMREIPKPKERWPLVVRSIASGGEPLGEETLRWGKQALDVQINEFYGQTECNVVLGNSGGVFTVKANSMGRQIPGHTVSVIDEMGVPVSHGEKGEIAVQSPDPVMFLGYWNRPDATKRKFVNGWLRTGDMGYQDADGYFFFIGRGDDIISSAGYRIGPAEIEETLCKHPAVLMAAVVGSPDSKRGEIIKAFIQLRETILPSEDLCGELQKWVKERLGAYEYPRELEFVNEFPMTPSGKIQRKVLKKREYERKGMPLS